MWYVYILECQNGSLYAGITNNPERRFKEHQEGKGCHFTRSFGAAKLVYQERSLNRSEALKREAQIKRWTRTKKFALISSDSSLLKKI